MRISDWSSDVCSSIFKASRGGPEYALTTGLGPGTDYYLVRVRDWKMYRDPKTCGHQVSLGYDDARLRVTAASSFFGSPSQIGRSSRRERGCRTVWISVVALSSKQNIQQTDIKI